MSNDHWSMIFTGLWSQLANPSTKAVFPEQNPTGPNVTLCCSNGKVAMHRTHLKKFTILLDIVDDITWAECVNPWGAITLILPQHTTEVLQALGRLIYCGDSGNLTGDVMQEIVKIIRPEFGGDQGGPKSQTSAEEIDETLISDDPQEESQNSVSTNQDKSKAILILNL